MNLFNYLKILYHQKQWTPHLSSVTCPFSSPLNTISLTHQNCSDASTLTLFCFHVSRCDWRRQRYIKG